MFKFEVGEPVRVLNLVNASFQVLWGKQYGDGTIAYALAYTGLGESPLSPSILVAEGDLVSERPKSKISDADIEQEIQAKGLTAPRVTPDHIESIIIHETYFTAADGRYGSMHSGTILEAIELDDLNQLKCLTFCVLVLANGFTVTGESACASPENFDPDIGRSIARQNAVNKIWPLEGYLLKQKLSEE